MPYETDYFGKLLERMSDLESTKAKNLEAEAQLRELEAKVAELEERERLWQNERRILLLKVEDHDETKE